MPSTPNITVTFLLKDLQGNDVGSVGSPAYIRIALCGFGPFVPRIPGGVTMGQVATWPRDIPYTGAAIEVDLWGNDVIIPNSPIGTYYAISILDANRNVIQTGAYVFTGTEDVDFSDLSPFFPNPISPVVMGGLVAMIFSATPLFNCALVDGPITFDMILSGDVTSSTLISAFPGQLVTFVILQDGAGAHTFAWPSNVKNAGLIDPEALSVTTQTFVARANGNLYPIGPQTYS